MEVMELAGRSYALIGLERQAGFMVRALPLLLECLRRRRSSPAQAHDSLTWRGACPARTQVYDVTEPRRPRFIEYWNNRNRTAGLELPDDREKMGDLAPEMIKCVRAPVASTSFGEQKRCRGGAVRMDADAVVAMGGALPQVRAQLQEPQRPAPAVHLQRVQVSLGILRGTAACHARACTNGSCTALYCALLAVAR